MKKILIATLLISFSAMGQSTFQDKKFGLMPNVKCGLKRFALSTYTSTYTDPDLGDFATKMAAVIETSNPSCLKEYGVVQFIKGCVFEEHLNAKNERSGFYSNREFHGHKTFLFVHPDWEIDAAGSDPLYYNLQGDWGRTDTYLVPKVPLKLTAKAVDLKSDEKVFFNDDKYETYYFAKDKGARQFFVIDTPTGSQYSYSRRRGALTKTNSNLLFKTCVYKLSDVTTYEKTQPFSTSPEKGGPIHCLDWSHQQEWNQNKLKFEKKPEIPSHCLKFQGERILKVMNSSN